MSERAVPSEVPVPFENPGPSPSRDTTPESTSVLGMACNVLGLRRIEGRGHDGEPEIWIDTRGRVQLDHCPLALYTLVLQLLRRDDVDAADQVAFIPAVARATVPDGATAQ